MNYIILDFEFNQSFDWGNGIKSNPKCTFEIIQIGAVKLNKNFKIISEFEILIKPQLYTRLHPIVEKLTGLKESLLEDKDFFPVAYESFLNFIDTKDCILCFWGANDMKALYRNIIYHNLNHTLINPKFINVQNMASKFLNNPLGISIGLKNAVQELNIDTPYPFHNALNDARYTAKVLVALKKEPFLLTDFDISSLGVNKLSKKK